MRALVTGAAGFIGSNLSDLLLDNDIRVIGVDSFTDYYDQERKRHNASRLQIRRGFDLIEGDLNFLELDQLLDGIDVVYHLAGQPGVRASWASGFDDYLELNVRATQRLLEAAKRASTPPRFVNASSSSVYGNAAAYPCREGDIPAPFSPYAMTKLSGEHLARLYSANYALPTVSLRYFTVYGPRQRPEMAMAQMIEAAITGSEFKLFAAEGAIRDFTYVGDVARATMLAGTTPDLEPGLVLNVSGGTPCTMDEVLDTLTLVMAHPVNITRTPTVPGDVLRTGGDASLAAEKLGWVPQVGLREGLAAQVEARRAQRNDQMIWLPREQVDLRS